MKKKTFSQQLDEATHYYIIKGSNKSGGKMKGKSSETKAKEMLEKTYPFVEGPPVRTKWHKQDYFGLFDFLCCDIAGEITGIQVSDKYMSQRNKEWKKAWERWPGRKIFIRWERKEKKWVNF